MKVSDTKSPTAAGENASTIEVSQAPHSQRLAAQRHMIASQGASAIVTLLLYPIDVVRVRFMSQDGTVVRQHNGQTYHSVTRAVRTMYNEERLFVFYRGCHVAVLGVFCAWGVYMYTYRSLCGFYASFRERQGSASKETSDYASGRQTATLSELLDTFLQRFGLSILASSASAIVCNPIWLMKTRMQVEDASRGIAASDRHFRTLHGGVAYSIRTGGLRSLWRGVSAQVLLGIPNAATLPVYDTMKAYLKLAKGKQELSVAESSVCSGSAKIMVAIFAHPIAVLKTRMQDYRARTGTVHYIGLAQTARTVWVKEGIRGMFRGLLPSLYQSVPRTIMTFVIYEKALQLVS